ncbi:ABC transporter F family member 4-like isoform X2 [Maniola jurtina]|uniref:ABC transporter F family member 4-like isoform X2 n=1 Tax=Maniola jurtina TaxID=191418 RepID=UPI001E68C621|nr:ABC transporter F family member 4-like isoform X2 [Maniola jurtina]
MKSKSFDVPKSPADKVKQNKTYDFINFYKSAAETNVKLKSDNGSSKENGVSNKLRTPKRVSNKNKKKPQNDSVDMSNIININGDSIIHAAESSSLDESKVTSTPYTVKKGAEPKVKSIIKNKSLINSSLNVSNVSISSNPKKRNKSVSFMLDDTEEVAIKRCKSEETVNKLEKSIGKTKKPKKFKKKQQDEKENKSDASNMVTDTVPTEAVATTSKLHINDNVETIQTTDTDSIKSKGTPEKKKRNKLKKAKNITAESESSEVVKNEGDEHKLKKIKKKKRHIKSVGTDNTETEGEPAQKSSKKDVKPEKIAQDLENLTIGDNAHTLTDLLDEMTVLDKNKKKKNKKKAKDKESKQKKGKPLSASNTNSEGDGAEEKKKGKDKKKKIDKANTNNAPDESMNTDGEEEKEKAKLKRKLNKAKKGVANVDRHLTSVIIENLPLALMFTYKKLLSEHFEKFGLIRQVGVAEMYPTEEPRPVFTTSINFASEDAAEKALEDDNTVFEGARIRVKRPLSPTLTTLVVRSYAKLTEQAVSSVFSSAGRIRSIRLLIKGKKALSTAFIEFDGPKSVERAIKMAEEVKIGGKNIHVAKFELRASNMQIKQENPQEENESSDNSNE